MRKFVSSPLYVYHKKKKMAAKGLNKQGCGCWYVEFTDGTRMQCMPSERSNSYAKVISEEDYKWIAGAESKKWKRNKSAWDKYQIERAHRIVAAL
jgi:hypothetical protein